ncbi:alpha/beta fold hydrolase [Tianweitania sediminis]|uniref:Alpha/beta hydrolase n=1 Tax=Tianweitania sediminis TaxID=1502156 RepID=A0A8J7UKQ9_9HYPH|nr:alpha/beta hydrolase [Tianweitania sediminis]MBP0441438.1 alpha/beta hydrolase [Tianweitania sediminis]
MTDVASKFIDVGAFRTHYLEAGSGPTLVLLHSGEFGGCAELTWEFNISELAEHFHVLAPDWLGFGQTDKWFSFDDMWSARVKHIAEFLKEKGVGRANFAGNSMGAGTLLSVAAQREPAWQIDRLIAVNGGGRIPPDDDQNQQILSGYDGTREHMERLTRVIVRREDLRADPHYVDRRQESARRPGAWECTAAARFRAPFAVRGGREADYRAIRVPTLLAVGRDDPLRPPEFWPWLHSQIEGSTLQYIEGAGHCPQIDRPEEFNRIVIEFIKGA